MNTGIIYKITNTITQKVYIGQTTRSIEVRFKEHINTATRGAPYKISRTLRKHPKEVFTIESIVEGIPIIFLDSFEKYWIHFYNSYKLGYNETTGGGGTIISSWNKGKENCYSLETLSKMRNAKLGVTPTNMEQLATLSKQRCGTKHQNHKLANVYNYKDNSLIAENIVISQWCKERNLSQGNLSNTARGIRKQYLGMYAQYL